MLGIGSFQKLWVLIIIVACMNPVRSFAKEHPFLLINKAMYVELNSRTNQSPWKEWKQEAITKCKTLVFQTSSLGLRFTMGTLASIMDACALSYVLDSTNRTTYKNKIINSLHNWPTLYPQVDPKDWSKTVPPGTAFFLSVLALDVIYDDLTLTEQTTAMNDLRPSSNPWPFTWPHNFWSTHAIWSLFNGNQADVAWAKKGYRQQLFGPSVPGTGYNQLQHVTAQGAYGAGSSYGLSKLGCASISLAKCHIMDVFDFTGEDQYYQDAKVQNLYRWLLVFTRNPFGGYTTFGDAFLRSTWGTWDTPRFQAISRFSDDLAPLVSWWQKGASCSGCSNSGLFLSYVLSQKQLPSPKKPTSTIFLDGGAAFWDEESSEKALMGAMLNMTISEWHTHKEVNAIYLAGYGEHLLVNAGYAGACCGVNSQFTRTWFGHNANSANTVLIDGIDHGVDDSTKYVKSGNGQTEAFVSELFDYTSGDSGGALPNGHHQRNFIFVHPQDNKIGYFVLLDEVKANTAKVSNVHVLLHPLSNQYTAITVNQEYQWTMNGIFLRNKSKATYLTAFLATPPKSVLFKDGAHADGTASYMIGKYIESIFQTNSQGTAQVLTGLFPHDPSHLKPNLIRNSTTTYSSMLVDHGNMVKDQVFIANGQEEVLQPEFAFIGKGLVVRQVSTNSSLFYFVRQGTSFLTKASEKIGFKSTEPISVHLRSRKGKIVSSGTNVTFFYPQITSILLNGQKLNIIKQEMLKSVEVFIPKGTHSLELSTNPQADTHVPKAPTSVILEIKKSK